MKLNKLLNILHMVIQRKLQSREDFWNHAGAQFFMSVESPAIAFFESFRGWLGYIMHQGRPSQPKVIAHLAHVVNDLERVIKVILVRHAMSFFYALQLYHFGKELVEQAGIKKQGKSNRGLTTKHDL